MSIAPSVPRPFAKHTFLLSVGASLLGHVGLLFILARGAEWLAPRYEFFPSVQVTVISEQDLAKILEPFAPAKPPAKPRAKPAAATKPKPKPVATEKPPKPVAIGKPPKPAPENKTLETTSKKAIEEAPVTVEDLTAEEDSVFDEIAEDLSSEQEKNFDQALRQALGEERIAEELPARQDLLSESILTAQELAAFRRHIYACWSPPIGAPALETLVVDLLLSLDTQAYVVEVRVKDQARMERDPFFRVAAEAALRTLSDPACAPLLLPLEKYDLWQKTILRFDPRRLFGS